MSYNETEVLNASKALVAVRNLITDCNVLPDLPAYLNYEPLVTTRKADEEIDLDTGETKPIEQETETRDDRFIVYNRLTGKEINSIGSVAKPVNHEFFYNYCREALEKSDLDLTNARTTFHTDSLHANLYVKIVLPNVDFAKYIGDKSHLQINILASHDGSSKRVISAEIHRLFCENGCTHATEKLFQNQRQTKFSDIRMLVNKLNSYPRFLETHAEQLAMLRTKKVTQDQAFNLFKATLLKNIKFEDSKGKPKTPKAFTNLVRLWNKYELDGDTAWRMYNVLTDYATHIENENNAFPFRKFLGNRKQVAEVLVSKEYAKLVT